MNTSVKTIGTELMKVTHIDAHLDLSPFTRDKVTEPTKRKIYLPCVAVTYLNSPDDEVRSFVVGGPYDTEKDAFEAAVTVIAAFHRLCDPSQQQTALPELIRLALAEQIPPESAAPIRTHRPL